MTEKEAILRKYGYSKSVCAHSIFKHCPNCGQALDWSETE